MINAVQVLLINGTGLLGAEENQLRTISGAANRKSTYSIKDLVKYMVNMDRRTTIGVIADKLGVSCSAAHGIFTEELGMRRYCR